LYTVRDYTNSAAELAETLEKIAAIGYTAVQVSGFGAVDPKDVALMMVDNGLTVASTHTAWERYLTDLDAVIAEHKLWRCPHPAIGGLPGRYSTLDGLKRFLDELYPIAERLAQEGMDFSYHNHNHELARHEGKTWLARLYDEADPSLLKAEIDTYWIQAGGGDPAYWVQRCAGREPLLHLKDMAITPEREQRMAEVGEGNLNWPAIFSAAEAAGVEWYFVEQDHCYDRSPFESLAISYRNLTCLT
jgi:sugar phosphate isomerase/epimerase